MKKQILLFLLIVVFPLMASANDVIDADNVFYNDVFTTATLTVPPGSKALYANALGWQNFKNITDGTENDNEIIATIDSNQGLIEVARGQGWIPADANQMTKADAEKVTDLGTAFKENNTIASFDELRFFTGLTSIGAGAFASSSITSVILPETVTEIGAGAFRWSSLKSITLPAALTTVGEFALYNCYLLREVTSLNPNPAAIPNLEFYKNDVTLYVPSGTKALYEAADGWRLLTRIVDPAEGEQVFEVGDLTYYKLADGSVCVIDGQRVSGECSIPATVNHGGTDYQVTMIACGAFSGNKALTSVVIPNGVTYIGSFEACSGLATVTLPLSIDPIDIFREFWHCSSLTSITLPEGVVEIDESAFSGCKSLTSITIPKSLTRSHRYAFSGCEAISEVHILDVASWNNIRFDYGGPETGVIPTSNPLYYANRVFLMGDEEPSAEHKNFGDVSTKTLFVPKGSKDAYEKAEFWQDFKEIKEMGDAITPLTVGDTFSAKTAEGVEMTFKVVSSADKTCQVGDGNEESPAISSSASGAITIPSSIKGSDGTDYTVTSIGHDAFLWCNDIVSVEIPTSVNSIGNGAFMWCSNLASVTIPHSVETIESYAFRGCSSLESITIPNSVKSIGVSVFSSCNNLMSISVEEGNPVYDSPNNCNAIIETATKTMIAGCQNTIIPTNVTKIARRTFWGTSSLKTLFIPKSVTNIGFMAFSGCSGLTSITVEDGNPVYDSRGNCNAIIHSETNELVCGCQNTVIPTTVTSIGNYAFEECRTLETLNIPTSVVTIGEYAFMECTGLTSISVPSSVATIGQAAFNSCEQLVSFTIPEAVTRIEGWTFNLCRQFASITIPKSVTAIGEYAFYQCYGLKQVISKIRKPFAIEANVFSEDTYNATLCVPSGTKSLYEQTDGWNRFKNIVEILMPMEDSDVVDFGENGSINEETDLSGTIIDNVFINIDVEKGDGRYDPEEKCVVLNKAMTEEEIEAVFGNEGNDLYSDEVKTNYAGMVIEVPAGKGEVTVEAQTTGGMTLKVKIGSAEPIEMKLEGKQKMKFPYDVNESTYIYIYAGVSAASVRAGTRGNDNDQPSLCIYGISTKYLIKPGDVNGDGVVSYSDVMAVLNRILGGASGNKFVEEAADVNNDSKITIADALAIMDIILEKNNK